jgi:hypothetical protein
MHYHKIPLIKTPFFLLTLVHKKHFMHIDVLPVFKKHFTSPPLGHSIAPMGVIGGMDRASGGTMGNLDFFYII